MEKFSSLNQSAPKRASGVASKAHRRNMPTCNVRRYDSTIINLRVMFIQTKPAMYLPIVSIKLNVVRMIKFSHARPEAELELFCRKDSCVAARDRPGKTKNVSMKVKQIAVRRPLEA